MSRGKLRAVMWDFAGDELPTEVLSGCESVAEAIPQGVATLLEQDECAALRRRAASLLRKRRFRRPRRLQGFCLATRLEEPVNG